MCLKKIELRDLKFDNYSRLNNQHKCENLYDHLMSIESLYFENN
jgi:hypothetical protein